MTNTNNAAAGAAAATDPFFDATLKLRCDLLPQQQQQQPQRLTGRPPTRNDTVFLSDGSGSRAGLFFEFV